MDNGKKVFKGLFEYLGKKDSRPWGKLKATKIVTYSENLIALRYHDTFVVRLFSSGDFILDSGGWLTLTTKSRINSLGVCQVYQKNFKWYVTFNEKDYPFSNGMLLQFNGKVIDRHGREVINV